MARKKAADTENAVTAPAEAKEEKAPVKKTVTKKPAAEGAEEASKKTAAKKPATRKTPAKKAEPEITVTIQFQGREIATAQIAEAAKAAFAQANPDVEIKSVDVYVKPEEGVAYYAVNGEGSGDYKIEL